MLITIEGIDGSGKTTLINALKEKLSDLDVLFTCEPMQSNATDNEISKNLAASLRSLIAEDKDRFAEATLFVADHAVHLATVVQPALDAGKIVICDRYVDSRYAYQVESLDDVMDNPYEWITNVHKGWSIEPDITFILVISLETAEKRLYSRNSMEHFENTEFLKHVQQNYNRIARCTDQYENVFKNNKRYVYVDAERSPEEVATAVESYIRKSL